MKGHLIAAAIFVAHGAALNAGPIEIILGSSRITPFFATPFNDVNGVSLNGQSLSLNFVFTDNFIRLLPPPGFPQTSVDFDISITSIPTLIVFQALVPVLALSSIRQDNRWKPR